MLRNKIVGVFIYLLCIGLPAFRLAGLLNDGSVCFAGDYVYDSKNKRNPFIPLLSADGRFLQLDQEQQQQKEAVLKIEGIIFDKYGVSYAVINGQPVRVGDAVEDYQVLRIDKDKVTLVKGGQPYILELKKEDSK